MPRFDFRCNRCGRIWQDIQVRAHVDTEIFTCTDCLDSTLEKLPAAPNFVLKGAGFYRNTYGYGKDAPKS